MNDVDCVAIGRRIRELRNRKGISQQNLADLIEMSLRSIQKYESGETEPTVSAVNAIARVLNSDPVYILGYQETRPRIKSFADIADFLFQMDEIEELDMSITMDTDKSNRKYDISLTFDGADTAHDFNPNMYRLLREWADEREACKMYMSTREYYEYWQQKKIHSFKTCYATRKKHEDLDHAEFNRRRNAAFGYVSERDKKDE